MKLFSTLYIEKDVLDHPRVIKILNSLGNPEYQLIEDFNQVWGRAKKPYLQKRDKLNLFLAKKRGQKVKLAPEAYGLDGAPHYYFVHAFNCVFECQYCYLQGYFNTPDLVWFINHEEIVSEMQEVLERELSNTKRVWFHAGEFSDSLAMSHLTHDLPCYHQFLETNPKAYLELRTKSVNLRELKKLKPLPNLITSFSLSTQLHTEIFDLKTPDLKIRIKAIQDLRDQGYKVAIHLDPIVYHPKFKDHYQSLMDSLNQSQLIPDLQYVSLGVVRFTKDVYFEVEQNYPDSQLLKQPFVTPSDGKIRYPLYMRKMILREVRELLLQAGMDAEKVYYCMENSFHLET
jgi:spore photoproduct lyase